MAPWPDISCPGCRSHGRHGTRPARRSGSTDRSASARFRWRSTPLIADWQWAWLFDWLVKTLFKGLVLMLLMLPAPLVVFVVAAVLVVPARPWLRVAALRAVRRSLRTAAFTELFMIALFWVIRDPAHVAAFNDLVDWLQRTMYADVLRFLAGPALTLVLAAGLVWVLSFSFSAVYLAQRNGLGHLRSLPLQAPLVQALMAWVYLAVSVGSAWTRATSPAGGCC